MPGSMGPVVLDSFAAGMPMVTANFPYHGSIIDYLQHGHNGYVGRCSPEELICVQVDKILTDEKSCARARRCSPISIENMAERFAEGIATPTKVLRVAGMRWKGNSNMDTMDASHHCGQ
jgi:hypothetical protein